MNTSLTARQAVTINAPVESVWNALTDPKITEKYMSGTAVESDWHEGSTVVFRGVFHGKQYVDKGSIIRINPGEFLQYSHYDPAPDLKDAPDNYHIITIKLSKSGSGTGLELLQDNNETEEECARSAAAWGRMLEEMKNILENKRAF